MDEEDVSGRLDSDQFGYQSTHYSVKLPEDWLNIPTLVGLGVYRAEVQVRTLSQHIWAVASHKLQYKQENNVPMPVRRSINRVSALLETVDLEFERVLFEREKYINQIDEDKEFNVNVLEVLCDRLLPKDNKEFGNEDYSELFTELLANGINNVASFVKMIEQYLSEQLQEDQQRVSSEVHHPEHENIERLQKGVFYTHVGLVRGCLQELRGDDYESIDFL